MWGRSQRPVDIANQRGVAAQMHNAAEYANVRLANTIDRGN